MTAQLKTDVSTQSASNVTGFPVGTRIRTEFGERAVETLQPGDRIITRNGKLARVVAVRSSDAKPKDRPVRIAKNALGGGLPRRDVILAPDQLVLMADPLLEQLFDCASAVLKARDLIHLDGVHQDSSLSPLGYVQLECEAPEVVFCSGLPCISHSWDLSYGHAPRLERASARVFLSQL